ncbi:uncharacterized protein [Hemitrygon akajei]|uniref:uncharacterized protein isoform X1 n=1 Tax=Hemitrygon akajei TaxID=2704970 RepID=UPI003BF99BB7
MSTRSSIKSLSKSSSSCDRGSRASSTATQARAKAELANVRACFAKQELEVKMKAAAREAENQKEEAAREAENQRRKAENELERKRVEAELEVLKLEREAAAARVEAELIEDAEEMHDPVDGKSTSEKIGLERTSDYVQSQIEWKTLSSSPYLFDNVPLHEETQRGPTASHPSEEDNLPSQLRDESRNERAHDQYFSTPNLPDLGRREARVEFRTSNSTTNVRPQSCTCRHVPSARMPLADEPVARYFAQRDLVTSGLYQFDDKPENYRAWHSTFTNAIDGVQLRATQELDLMAKWLGKESCEQEEARRKRRISDEENVLSVTHGTLPVEKFDHPFLLNTTLREMSDTIKRVSVTLDVETASPCLEVSEDRKSVRNTGTCRDLPDTRKRFTYWICLLGSEGFTSGRHYWEVEVTGNRWWGLGVAAESVERKRAVRLSPETGFWIIERHNGKMKAFTSPESRLPVDPIPGRVEVYLSYESGTVSFYNAETKSHLHTFTGNKFTEKLYPLLGVADTNQWLRICSGSALGL